MIEGKTRPEVEEEDELSFSFLIIHSTKLTFTSHNTTDQSGPSQLPKFKATINQMNYCTNEPKYPEKWRTQYRSVFVYWSFVSSRTSLQGDIGSAFLDVWQWGANKRHNLSRARYTKPTCFYSLKWCSCATIKFWSHRTSVFSGFLYFGFLYLFIYNTITELDSIVFKSCEASTQGHY